MRAENERRCNCRANSNSARAAICRLFNSSSPRVRSLSLSFSFHARMCAYIRIEKELARQSSLTYRPSPFRPLHYPSPAASFLFRSSFFLAFVFHPHWFPNSEVRVRKLVGSSLRSCSEASDGNDFGALLYGVTQTRRNIRYMFEIFRQHPDRVSNSSFTIY